MLEGQHILVAGGGDVDVGHGRRRSLRAWSTSVPFHRRLQRVDRIDLGDRRRGSRQRTQTAWARALADVAVTAHHRQLAGQHHVHRALQAIGQRLAAAVEIVELRLGDRVVDVDRRDQQLALGVDHLVQTVHASGGFFGDTPLDQAFDDITRKPARTLLGDTLQAGSWIAAKRTLLFVARRRATAPKCRRFPSRNGLPRCRSRVTSPPSSTIDVRVAAGQAVVK